MSTLVTAARPLPQRLPALRIGVAIALVGAPLSWFALICAGYALSSAPCFVVDQRAAGPTAHWTSSATLGLLITSSLTGLLTAVYCWRELRRGRRAPAQESAVADSGAARTRFLLRWGAIAGVAYALASMLSAIGYAVLPRCAG